MPDNFYAIELIGSSPPVFVTISDMGTISFQAVDKCTRFGTPASATTSVLRNAEKFQIGHRRSIDLVKVTIRNFYSKAHRKAGVTDNTEIKYIVSDGKRFFQNDGGGGETTDLQRATVFDTVEQALIAVAKVRGVWSFHLSLVAVVDKGPEYIVESLASLT